MANPHVSAKNWRDRRKTMSELNNEYRKRKGYGHKYHEDGYHTVEKGCTDSLDSDELDLFRFMMGGMQGK